MMVNAAAVISELNAIRTAQAECARVLGGLALDAASASDVYREALRAMGVSTKGIDPTAFAAVFKAARAHHRYTGAPLMAQDSASADSFAKRFPEAARIRGM